MSTHIKPMRHARTRPPPSSLSLSLSAHEMPTRAQSTMHAVFIIILLRRAAAAATVVAAPAAAAATVVAAPAAAAVAGATEQRPRRARPLGVRLDEGYDVGDEEWRAASSMTAQEERQEGPQRYTRVTLRCT